MKPIQDYCAPVRAVIEVFVMVALIVGVSFKKADAQIPTPSPAPSPISITIHNVFPPNPAPITPTLTYDWRKDLPWPLFAAIIAGFFALRSAGIAQKEAEQKRNEEKNATKRREERETIQYDRKELQDQFVNIQNRLTQNEPFIRTNAVQQLGEFARTPKPRVATGDVHEPALMKNEDNYPYFSPVVTQLATALYLDPLVVTRKAIKNALARIVDFAKDEEDQYLLHLLINQLADVNRNAKQAFIKAIAQWSVVDPTWQALVTIDQKENLYQYHSSNEEDTLGEHEYERMFNLLASVAPFCDKLVDTRQVLKDLMSEGQFQNDAGKVEAQSIFDVQREIYDEVRKARTDAAEKAKADALLLPSLEIAAQQLIDTKDALVAALKALTEPCGIPTEIDENTSWERKYPLLLQSCFLPNADFGYPHSPANLQNVEFNSCYLHCTNLNDANLQFANFILARLFRTRLNAARLAMSDFSFAKAQKAKFIQANLSHSIMTTSNLRGANLTGVIIKRTSFKLAHLEEACFDSIHFDAATSLYGVYFNDRTTFISSNWWNASLDDPTPFLRNQTRDTRTEEFKKHLEQFRNPPNIVVPAEDRRYADLPPKPPHWGKYRAILEDED